MPKLFEQIRADEVTASPEEARLFADLPLDPAALASAAKEGGVIEQAEKLLGHPVPELPASLYMRFYRTGNRADYENPYFRRRDSMLTLLMAELAEGKGRFTDALTDHVWAICEESTWVIPAHNAPCHGNPINCLPDSFDLGENDDVRHIDLFSAATGAAMTWVWLLGRDILDAVTPVIRRRIRSLIEKRIFHPYYEVFGENNWWMGEEGQQLNNWTPWIVSNVLTAVLILEEDKDRRTRALERSMTFLDRFTADYPADGGCDEGPGYWGVAGASYFDSLELIRDLTAGKVDMTGDPFVKRMCEYIADFRLDRGVWANFADASHRVSPDAALVARMARLTGSDKLAALAAECAQGAVFNRWVPSNTSYRSVRDLMEPYPAKTSGGRAVDEGQIFYPNLGVMIAKGAGMALAAKGGNNAESHNHNDVGSFILWAGGSPVFVDPGVGQYTRDTFSSKRYTLWTMRSTYHNLPAFRRAEADGYGEWIEQKPGGQYAARILSCESGILETDLKDAYPPEAGLKTYVRRVGLDAEGFFCEDRIAFDGEGEVSFSLMSREEWDPTGASGESGAYRLGGSKTEIRTDLGLTITQEHVPLESKLSREWGTDSLVRVRLTSEPFENKTFLLRVSTGKDRG